MLGASPRWLTIGAVGVFLDDIAHETPLRLMERWGLRHLKATSDGSDKEKPG